MKERFRDKTRDNLAYALNLLGVHAELAERGRIEEKVQSSWKTSLGVIDLHEGPFRCVNLVRREGSQHSPPQWFFIFCVADERDSPFGPLSVKTIRRRRFPQVWKITSVEWAGDDYATGLLAALADDKEVDRFAKRIGDVEIRRYDDEFEGWTLQVNTRFTPTMREWRALSSIAERLLAVPSGL